MILRQLVSRNGTIYLYNRFIPVLNADLVRTARRRIQPSVCRDARRWLSSEVESVERSAQRSTENIQSIEALMNSATGHAVQDLPVSSTPEISATQLAAQDYREFKRQRAFAGTHS